MVYRCEDCGKVFDAEDARVKTVTDFVPYGDTSVPMDSVSVYCPHCGSGYLEDYEEDEEDD